MTRTINGYTQQGDGRWVKNPAPETVRCYYQKLSLPLNVEEALKKIKDNWSEAGPYGILECYPHDIFSPYYVVAGDRNSWPEFLPKARALLTDRHAVRSGRHAWRVEVVAA